MEVEGKGEAACPARLLYENGADQITALALVSTFVLLLEQIVVGVVNTLAASQFRFVGRPPNLLAVKSSMLAVDARDTSCIKVSISQACHHHDELTSNQLNRHTSSISNPHHSN